MANTKKIDRDLLKQIPKDKKKIIKELYWDNDEIFAIIDSNFKFPDTNSNYSSFSSIMDMRRTIRNLE